MQVLYINVASQTARCAALEKELDEKTPATWRRIRVDAVTPDSLTTELSFAGLAPFENACYQSHLRALALAASSGEATMIVEDDVQFAPQTAAMVDGALRNRPDDGWDVLFTDVAITEPAAMLELFQLRQRLQASGKAQVLDLRQLPFCGSTAYIVHPGSVARLRSLAGQNPHALPYDLMLRQAVYDGHLRAGVIFPFPTTLSADGDTSQIQPASTQATDLVWNAYRRLVWLGPDLRQVEATMGALPAGLADPASRALGQLLAAAVSPAFARK